MSRDQILAASKARNTHSKRDRAPHPASGGAASARAAELAEAEDEEAEAAVGLGGAASASDDGHDDWQIKARGAVSADV
jgi:hypothetical protein